MILTIGLITHCHTEHNGAIFLPYVFMGSIVLPTAICPETLSTQILLMVSAIFGILIYDEQSVVLV